MVDIIMTTVTAMSEVGPVVSVRTTFYRGNHQDEGRRAELDLNSLCVSIKEILFFPLGKIQICLRKELGVSSLCSRCFRDG